MQIIVLGMHRSGTSPLTRLLNMMGAYVGIEGTLKKANPENPKGFWERKDVLALNKEVLSVLGADWHKVATLDLAKMDENMRRSFKSKAVNILLNLEPHRPWVIKEPRMCLLFPLWREVLEVPVCVLIHRSPLQVAQSLRTRNGFPLRFGIALWEQYQRSALASTIGLPRLLVSHRQLMEQPVQTVQTLYDELVALNVQGVRCPSDKEILAFIEPHLYREHGDTGLEEQYINRVQRKLLQSLEDRSALDLQEIPPLSAGAGDVLAEYEADDAKQQLSQQTHAALQAKEVEVVTLQQQFAKERAAVEAARQEERRQFAAEMGKTKQALADKERHIQRELRRFLKDREQLGHWIEQLDRGFSDVVNSKRWKLGHALGSAYRKLLWRPPLPLPHDYQRAIREKFHTWRRNVTEEKKGPFSHDKPVSSPVQESLPRGERLSPLSLVAGRTSVSADIVICIHNALDDIQRCLASVKETLPPHCTLYLVNDGSDAATSVYLRQYAATLSACVLLENSTATGYTRAANRGLRAATAEYVILLNSDTIVPHGWIEKLVECAESHPRIGVVGPLSNAASWQSVPQLHNDAGEWAINALPEDYSVELMARTIALLSEKQFPRVPFLNGFCFAIKRSVIQTIGYFDEDAFPHGYGEENDYCLRVANAGFELAVADHAYVFHAKSKSYQYETKLKLTQAGNSALRKKHGARRISQHLTALRQNEILERIRHRVDQQVAPDTAAEVAFASNALTILFLLPVRGGGGGSHSVVQEAVGMRTLGVRVHIAIPSRYQLHFSRNYAALDAQEDLFYFYEQTDDLIAYASQFTVVIATIFHSVDLMTEIVRVHQSILPVYYVQDYEPWFFPQESKEWQRARASYALIPDMVLFAKTRWLCQLIEREHGVKVEKVVPSLDQEVYFPALEKRAKTGPVQVAAMIRPATPRRGAQRTMAVLKKLQREFDKQVEIHIFGCTETDSDFQRLAREFSFHHHGILVREQVAQLLRGADIFVDFSDYQAFGRTGLEAMACGCAVILPEQGGVHEYAQDRENAVLVNTRSEEACYAALVELVADTQLRQRLSHQATKKAVEYSLYKAALAELAVLNRAWRERTNKNTRTPGSTASIRVAGAKKIRVLGVLPRRRFNQWPASAYIRVLLPLCHPVLQEQLEFFSVPVEKIFSKDADILLVQRTAVPDEETASQLLDYCQSRKIHTVYETDDQLFAIPPIHGEAADYARLLTGAKMVAQHVDLLTVASNALAASLKNLNANIVVLPNVLDEQIWFSTDRPPLRTTPEKIRILYMGSRTHLNDLLLIEDTMKRLGAEYGGRVALDVIGGVPAESVQPWFNAVRIPEVNYPAFVEWLRRESQWTIGIAPLADTAYNQCKSYIKYLDYAALGLATICSDVEPYQQVIRSGSNGILVENSPEAWYHTLKRVIEDEGFRYRLAHTSYQDVIRHHLLKDHAARWLTVLQHVMS